MDNILNLKIDKLNEYKTINLYIHQPYKIKTIKGLKKGENEYFQAIVLGTKNKELTKEEIVKITIENLFNILNPKNEGLNYEVKSLIRNELRKYSNNL